jgi:hypothetical protein
VTENEGETEDNCGKRYERRQCVGTVEDEKADEHNDNEPNTEEDCVQLCESRARVFYARNESFSFFVNSLDGFSHLFLGNVSVAVLVEYRECSVLPVRSDEIQGEITGGAPTYSIRSSAEVRFEV